MYIIEDTPILLAIYAHIHIHVEVYVHASSINFPFFERAQNTRIACVHVRHDTRHHRTYLIRSMVCATREYFNLMKTTRALSSMFFLFNIEPKINTTRRACTTSPIICVVENRGALLSAIPHHIRVARVDVDSKIQTHRQRIRTTLCVAFN